MQAIDLSHGPLDITALHDGDALELHAEAVDPAVLSAALDGLRSARGLKTLRLRSRVRSLPLVLTELRGLQRLELVDPELPGLPSEISRLSRLRSLRLDLFHLASLPHSIGGLTRLRELDIDSHHLCGLPDGLRALQALRSLTLRLHHVYVHDWERPTHVRPRLEQSLEQLFTVLTALPALSSLTLGEPGSSGMGDSIFDHLPQTFAGLRALESLTLVEIYRKVALPHGVVMPGVRRLRASPLDATEAELQAMFPNASINPRDP